MTIILLGLLIRFYSSFAQLLTNDHHFSQAIRKKICFSTAYTDLNGFVWEDNSCQSLISAPDNQRNVVVPITTKVIKGGIRTSGAFYKCRAVLETVTFPSNNNIEVIEEFAFYQCQKLSSINFGSCQQIQRIGGSAFSSCISLSSVVLPAVSSFTMLSAGTFSNCKSLKSIFIPKNIVRFQGYNSTEMGGIFDASGLETISFDEESLLESIETHSFLGTYLVNITIPKNVKTITNCFVFCGNLENIFVHKDNTNFKSFNGVLYKYESKEIGKEKYRLCHYPCKKPNEYRLEDNTILTDASFWGNDNIRKVIFPPTINIIGSNCFTICSNLEEVIFLPVSSLTQILGTAFLKCSSLKEITLPQTVSSIGSGAFSNCPNLTLKFESASGNSYYEIIDKMLVRKFDLTVIAYFGKFIDVFTFDSRIENIGYYGMEGAQIRKLIIPETIKTIGVGAFRSSLYLEEVIVSGSETAFNELSFDACNQLKSVVFVKKEIKGNFESLLFGSSKSLKYIEIPRNVESIGISCFLNSGIEEIVFLEGSLLKTIDLFSFQNTFQLKNITFPRLLKNINMLAFENSGIENVKFVKNCEIEEIGSNSFKNAINLRSFEISPNEIDNSKSLKTIGESAFQGCGSIETFIIISSIKKINQFAFMDCTKLKTIIIEGSSLDTIVPGVFVNCIVLEKIEIQENHPYFKYENYVLFNKNQSDIVVYLPGSPNSEYEVPHTVENIVAHSFENAAKLTDLRIYSSSTKISYLGYRAFRNCHGLSTIKIPETVKEIGAEAFLNTSIVKCESVEYNILLKDDLLRAGISSIALNICPPTVMFTNNLINRSVMKTLLNFMFFNLLSIE